MPEAERCPECAAETPREALRATLWRCPQCGWYFPMPALERIQMLADPGSFTELARSLVSVDPLRFVDQRAYRARLLEARRQTGLREAAVTGTARLGGVRVVLIVFDFAFLGGTMGSVVGEKVADAFEVAARRRWPVVSVSSSGGARMQEGMLSLLQMAKTAAAQGRHHAAGLAYISVLAHPTFGGVAASFASLGDVLIAEPGAQIGFAGPRVIEATMGETLPARSHRAERLFAGGLVDLLVDRRSLREVTAYLVYHLRRRPPAGRARVPTAPPAPADGSQPRAWDVVQLARRPDRPTTLFYIRRLFSRFVELHGDRQFGDDPAIVGGLGELEGQTVMVIGHERGATPEESAARRRGMAYPEGYREALRLLHLAAKFHLPVVTFVDTPGAYPGYEAEQRGIAQALARNLQTMVLLPTPIVSVVIGEGGSGGALALAVADRALMLQYAYFSVISPEGASAILYRDASRAEDLAGALKLTAYDLRRLGIIDTIVPEPPGGAHADPLAAAESLRRHLVAALGTLRSRSPDRLLRRRYRKYRQIGRVGAYWREAVVGEVADVLDTIERRLPRRRGRRESPAS
jgi:acetyl-CoA carboxylase carboxyl transferase alpha subunit/acetyl-CoA carboxylase carboxyl transferase beta subunit